VIQKIKRLWHRLRCDFHSWRLERAINNGTAHRGRTK